MDYFSFVKFVLYWLDPEIAHSLAINFLKYNILPSQTGFNFPNLAIKVLGKDLPHPIGLAAGFDKNAECLTGLSRQNFSFIEVGTVTPLPQTGNLHPRLFRLNEDLAIINRMGFNNKGSEIFAKNLQKTSIKGLLGVNIGKNKDSKELFADYLKLLDKFYPFAGYITLNISSPNTPGLRNLHAHSILKEMLACITERVKELQVKYRKHTPVLLKIAPDLSDHNLEEISDIILKYQIEGLIVSNTTIERPSDLKSRYRNEAGGLSGKPLFAPSTLVLQKLYRLTQGKVLLIGCGGVFSGADAYAKIISGATLIQIYTALIYEGFGVINKINQELNQLLEYDGYRSITEAVGVGVK